MPEITTQYQSQSATLNANGVGTVYVGPTVSGAKWTITNMSTTGNSTSQPILRVYRGSVGDQYVINGTYTGNIDSNSDPIVLMPGERLACQWTQGTSGALMTVNVIATQEWGV